MHVLILGGNSDVGAAIAAVFARKQGAFITLASRNMELGAKKAKDITVRYQVEARAVSFDALDYDSHVDFVVGLESPPDVVVAAFGYLGDQELAQQDFQEARRIIETNYLGAVSILEILARDMEQRGRGTIIGLGSVAGLRGRQSNYIYGSAKGGFLVYLSGLRNRLHKAGVQVLTVLPGFVATKMTEHLDLPPKLTATPEQVARDVYSAFRFKRNIIYTRWPWRWIMTVIRSIPEFLFKRTDI